MNPFDAGWYNPKISIIPQHITERNILSRQNRHSVGQVARAKKREKKLKYICNKQNNKYLTKNTCK
jgi:hypothetical protein